MIEPSRPSERGDVLAWCLKAWHFMRATRPLAGPGIELRETPNGTIIGWKGGSGTTAKPICPFGEIMTWTTGSGESAETKTGIRGGFMECGGDDGNWDIANHELDLSEDGEWLVSIPVNVIVNRDNANEIILPGILSGTKPVDADWELTERAEDGSTNYPSSESPEVSDGAGKIYVPIGVLTITGGSAGLVPVGCGKITIGQCGGNLTHARG